MATYLHFAPAVALAFAVGPPTVGWRLMAVGALCAVMPDADLLLVALRLDPYSGTYGHRGFSHSLGFAMAIGLMGASWARRSQRSWRRTGLVGVYLALCTASHPLLDGVLDVGICNAWLWPLDGSRLCMGWRPVPMRGVALLGWERLGTELLWIGVPLLLIANGGMLIRAVLRPRGAGRDPISHQAASVDGGWKLDVRGGEHDGGWRMQRRRRVEAMRWLAQELQAGRLQRRRRLVG